MQGASFAIVAPRQDPTALPSVQAPRDAVARPETPSSGERSVARVTTRGWPPLAGHASRDGGVRRGVQVEVATADRRRRRAGGGVPGQACGAVGAGVRGGAYACASCGDRVESFPGGRVSDASIAANERLNRRRVPGSTCGVIPVAPSGYERALGSDAAGSTSARIFPTASSITSLGSRAMRFAFRARQSRLFSWSESTAPSTPSP